MPNPLEESRPAMRSRSANALPSILGMYAFAAATFIVAAHMAHWYGNAQSAIVLFPLVFFLGGLAQFYAGAWALRMNDYVALAMHGTWGAFWAAYGVLEILYASGRVVRPQGPFPELGFWFIVMAAITWGITFAPIEHKGITTLLALLAIGSTLEAIAELAGLDWLRILGGYFLIASALVAWYVGSALMMRFGKTVKAQPAIPVAHNESVHAV
jgi:succinate-acetate transporter protein